ncbi:type VI secretion system baseplate subunit TssK [Paraburkholderia sp. JHI869]|uniref:type VI secretion system baseplate subunit TssK n=1 Tax=Paraburkholderia sp. JHI869 TaxID=3112959 RepID=UPI0031761BFD
MNPPLAPATGSAGLRERVVWSEGMFLRPQHFQQLERYFERYVHLRCAPLQRFLWGFASLQIDEEALALGKVMLRAASGILPDGTPFDFSHLDEAPEALEVSADVRDATVVLALPASRSSSAQVTFGGGDRALARYVAHEAEIADVNEVRLEPALVQLGRLKLKLALAAEVDDDWYAMGVLRVVERRTDRQLVIEETYIPPLLDAHAHPQLAGYVQELDRLLSQRSELLAGRLAQAGRGGVSEVADFLLLQLVNRYLAIASHTAQTPGIHPELLFRDWLKLAADFATFTAASRRPEVLPVYQHDDLRATFGALFAELRRSLATVLDQHALQIALEEAGNGVRVAVIADTSLLRDAGFVLAVRADIPAESVRARFPSQIKLGPVERIRDLVQLQLPGIAVRPLPVAPHQIPYHAGHSYFEVDKGGDLWRQLERSGGLALHLAGDFPGLAMEFWAIREMRAGGVRAGDARERDIR